jgi:Regulator of ribonuclease activity B
MMAYAIVVFVVAVVIIVARVWFNMKRLRQANSSESWDEKVIAGLRSRGSAPFNAPPVDFFLALPDEAAAQGVRARLESEGFGVDTKPMVDDPELNVSLHATKTMKLIVPDMQELGRRMTALAAEFHGRYDGWAA